MMSPKNVWITAKYSPDSRTRAQNFRAKTIVELIHKVLQQSVDRNIGNASKLDTVLINDIGAE